MSTNDKTGATYGTVKYGICYMCTASCPQKIYVKDGVITGIELTDPHVARQCPRWKAQIDFIYHADRIKQPQKRLGKDRNSSWVPITWDEALDIAADKLLEIKKRYGPESVVFYIAYTKEPRPYFHRLAHAFGSPNYCTESSNCFSAQWLATALTYGRDYGYWATQSWTVNPATKCKLIWGSSVEHNNPRTFHLHIEAREQGMKLIVVDPRRTTLAEKADIHLQLRPGTDGALALGLLHVIIRDQLYDREFIEKWTIGFDGLREMVNDFSPARVAGITHVSADKIEAAAKLYASTKPAQVFFPGNSSTHHSNGVQSHRAIILLPAVTGNVEIPGGNGCPPEAFPVNDITFHDRIHGMSPGIGSARFPIWTGWYREMESNLIADQIDSGKPYPLKALFGAGLNPMFFPNSRRFMESVKKLDFVMVSDYFHTPGTQLADLVLPIASWLERPMIVNQPDCIRIVEPAVDPVGHSWPEFKIYFELAKRLGLSDDFWDGNIQECFNHILKPTELTAEELKKYPQGYKRQPRLKEPKYYEKAGFQTPSGKIEIASSVLKEYGHDPLPVYAEPAESPINSPEIAAEFPLVLTSGARNIAYTHSLFRNIPELRQIMPDPLIDINPADAAIRGIISGDMVRLTSLRGTVNARADVTDTVLKGVVNMLHHWPGEANINNAVDDKTLDPISGFAPFKSQLCQVQKA